MALNNDYFDNLLEEFKENYSSNAALIEKNVDEIITLLPTALAQAGVLVQNPIAKRIKTLESALGGIRRRRDARMERLRLRERFEKQEDWEQYWKHQNKPGRIDSVGEFPDCKSMFKALRDIGGIRILVYYPSHVEKVVEALNINADITVDRVIERGKTKPRDMFYLKKYVNKLEGKHQSDEELIESKVSAYRATHLHVFLSSNPAVIVELQIISVVMNAWAQIEHDLVYKPIAEPSNEDLGILEKFERIVPIADDALTQFEGTQSEDLIKTFAMGLHDLGMWIEISCAEKSIYPLKEKPQAWRYLELLLDVLQAGNQHNPEIIKSLIDDLSKTGIDESVFNLELPLHLARQFHKVHPNLITTNTTLYSLQFGIELARFLAFRVIHTINMAAYLGTEQDLLLAIRDSLPKGVNCPTIIDFLDILHPACPHIHVGADEKIIAFCRSFLEAKNLREFWRDSNSPYQRSSHTLALLKLPITLIEIGLVAYPNDCIQSDMTDSYYTTYKREVIVPGSLSELLYEPEYPHCLPELYSAVSDIQHAKIEDGYIINEYPAQRHSSKPRHYTGYFRADLQSDSQSPRWRYIKTMPKSWGLKKIKIPLEISSKDLLGAGIKYSIQRGIVVCEPLPRDN
ncbi:hypothetical protein ACMFMG_000454 [Clarireedia jacksonii]